MNILVTGANGFIGSNIVNFLEKNTTNNIFKGTRQSLNLFSCDSVHNYIDENKIDCIIHCAIEGGHRSIIDKEIVIYNNLLIAKNLMSCHINGPFINIASGAEFDTRKNIFNIKEEEIYNKVPTDYYGLSKNIISQMVLQKKNRFNLRLFGCFNYNELQTRFIKSNIYRYINNQPMIIHNDKYMDFMSFDDVAIIIDLYLKNYTNLPSDINLSYYNKYKLSEIANIINTLSNNKVKIEIENESLDLNYCGNGHKLNSLNLNFKGIHQGIKDCYKHYMNIL